MDRRTHITWLRKLLVKDVEYLCRRHNCGWMAPIAQTLEDIRRAHMQAVLFGGTLRSLLLSRLLHRRLGRPRDLDIVVTGTDLDGLRCRFRSLIARETRFGGLQLRRDNWQFDVWPLDRTWALSRDGVETPRFADLPSTTFLNLEAVAVDVWPGPGQRRIVYSGDDQFFEGIITQTLELNREENPYPTLCVVRSLLMARSTGFSIGPRLAGYLVLHGADVSDDELVETQRRHYGRIYYGPSALRVWLDHVAAQHARDTRAAVCLPRPRQMALWPESHDAAACCSAPREAAADRLHCLFGSSRQG